MRRSLHRIALTTAALVATFVHWGHAFAPDRGPEPSSAWLRIDYNALVDTTRLAHSGETVGSLLRKLDGRPFPPPGERPADNLAYRLLDPHLEPYAFVLPDVLDTIGPEPDPPMVEVGTLWQPGERQPAWAELLRSRKLVVESDGRGKFRVFLPWPSRQATGPSDEVPATDPQVAAREAWEAAWPVLRHVLAAERGRLARGAGGTEPPLDVEIHAYRHLPARGIFDLTEPRLKIRVDDTRAKDGRRPLDTAALAAVLARPVRIEGGRLDGDGTVRWLTTDRAAPPDMLGRPIEIADAAVAYRAVAHGGLAEPYMSLDRAATPWLASVSFGGRLQDTGLGLVSLLCDVRFKTFSLGIDPYTQTDTREQVRKRSPEFLAHLERFAADPASGAVIAQQTRFWFYPDDVDLTLSRQGDLLAIRRVRMTAASERVDEATRGATGEQDPPWTRSTVDHLNANYDAMAGAFRELADLDEAVRLLALFSWLQAAERRGLPVPDLDVLLDVELPAEPTPRRFPQMLTYNVLPAPSGSGAVEVFDQARVGVALESLQPTGQRTIPPGRRFRRARAALDTRLNDHAALAREMEAAAAGGAGPEVLEAYAYRAERLIMHQMVLGLISADRREAVNRRRAADPRLRVFSVGIGGIDLGLSKALARAEGAQTGLLGGDLPATPRPETPRSIAPVARSGPARRPSPTIEATTPRRAAADVTEAAPEPPSTVIVPDHGGAPGQDQAARIRRGSARIEPDRRIAWTEVVAGHDSPFVSLRRRIREDEERPPIFERFEAGRLFTYVLERSGPTVRAVPAISPPRSLFEGPAPKPPPSGEPAPLPEGLATLERLSTAPGTHAPEGGGDESPTVPLRLRASGRDTTAELPRGILQRLVAGREVDPNPGRPLGGLDAPARLVGGSGTLMVFADDAARVPPWDVSEPPRPGEEDPVRLAAALAAWWNAEPTGPRSTGVVVGTDPTTSPARWSAAPKALRRPDVLVPPDGFPGARGAWSAPVVAACGGAARVADALAPEPAPLVFLVSAEAPGALAQRLRRLSREPSLSGKLLGVVTLDAPMRADLPGTLLRESGLAGIGVFEVGPVGLDAALERVRAYLGALSAAPEGTRSEEVAGPFVWFY